MEVMALLVQEIVIHIPSMSCIWHLLRMNVDEAIESIMVLSIVNLAVITTVTIHRAIVIIKLKVAIIVEVVHELNVLMEEVNRMGMGREMAFIIILFMVP